MQAGCTSQGVNTTCARAAGFAECMVEGRDLVTPVPLERWDLDRSASDAPREVLDSNMLRFGAFAADVAAFDAGGFRLARAEAAAMDPQARALLHAVADARQVRLLGSR